jgi:signal peptidase
MKRVSRAIVNIVSLLCMILALVIIAPRVVGIRAFGVLSGSMEPTLPVGSLVYAVPTNQSEIQVGDIITYVLNAQGTVSTHRVLSIDSETGDFTVKGDANDSPDGSPVQYGNVVGVVKVHIPYLGYIVGFAFTTKGKIVVITLIVVLLLLSVLLKDEDEVPAAKVAAPPKLQMPVKSAKKKKKAVNQLRRGKTRAAEPEPEPESEPEPAPVKVKKKAPKPAARPKVSAAEAPIQFESMSPDLEAEIISSAYTDPTDDTDRSAKRIYDRNQRYVPRHPRYSA